MKTTHLSLKDQVQVGFNITIYVANTGSAGLCTYIILCVCFNDKVYTVRYNG